MAFFGKALFSQNHMVPVKGSVIRSFALPFLVVSLSSASAHAASLRPSGTIHSGSIYLSDLFSGLGKSQDRVLGPAPQPGKTIYIGGAQLIALADQYEVDWDDQSSSSQIALTRGAVTYGPDEYATLVRDHVMEENAGQHVHVTINHAPPLTVAEEGSKGIEGRTVRLSAFDWNQGNGHFTATVVPVDSSNPQSARIQGDIAAARSVSVYAASFPEGHVIQSGDVSTNDNYTGPVTPAIAGAPDSSEIPGMALKRSVSKGEPVQKGDVRRAILVHRNNPVLITYNAPGIRLTATGKAAEDGGVGQFVHVINLGNKMLLQGRVGPHGDVQVDASTTAVSLDSDEARKLNAKSINLK